MAPPRFVHIKALAGSMRPRSQFAGRNDLLDAVMEGDTMVIAAPFCFGLSEKKAAWLLAELAARKVAVKGELDRIEPGDDLSDMRPASPNRSERIWC
ncbi:hypothetical protein [Salipiger mangrovisoli]|uniref:Resolvase, N terminal domain n=1 Tax=Salipiger mangrovisoli TaxID=2865933 RepID=A0ABR9WX42_9RHOB|nr:hypothetical protein [Salipiger mangrovisoli]MBE9635801.1 hypothetical protein [Salipiger mangrovisoli]